MPNNISCLEILKVIEHRKKKYHSGADPASNFWRGQLQQILTGRLYVKKIWNGHETWNGHGAIANSL